MGRRPQETQRLAPRPLSRPDSHYRPVNVYAAHGYGPALLAGAEITHLLKRHPYGMNDTSVQILK